MDVRWQRNIGVGAEGAFRAFTADFGRWWPMEYTWSGSALVSIGIEPGAGGMCYEFGPHGFRCDWGRVRLWHVPRRLVFSWQIGPDRVPIPDSDKAGEVDVRFHEGGDMSLHHTGFERYGSDAERYRKAMASDAGWPFMLTRFADFLSAAKDAALL